MDTKTNQLTRGEALKKLLVGVFAIGVLAAATALALPCDGPGPQPVTPHSPVPQPYGPSPDSYTPYQPCANNGDCPAGKLCVNYRQYWDQWKGQFVYSGECKYPSNPPVDPGPEPYGPSPDAGQPYQPCANNGDCPAGKQCANLRQVWDQWRGQFVWQGQCLYGH